MAFQLDGFEIGESIGSGGFGEVYAARQLGIDRPVAIKVGHIALTETKDRLRFERECKALGKLSTHPNIATVHTSGTLADGRPYLVLEYIDGGDLLDWASANRATEAQVIAIGLDLGARVAECNRCRQWNFRVFLFDPSGDLVGLVTTSGKSDGDNLWRGNHGCGAYGAFVGQPLAPTLQFSATIGRLGG